MDAIQWTANDLGRQVFSARQRRGLTQGELAAVCRVARNTIARVERGEVWPRVELLRALAVALDVAADALLGITAAD